MDRPAPSGSDGFDDEEDDIFNNAMQNNFARRGNMDDFFPELSSDSEEEDPFHHEEMDETHPLDDVLDPPRRRNAVLVNQRNVLISG